MARPYGQKFLLALQKTKLDLLGIRLAKLCVKANLPATLVAVALETTPTTVYSWFRGQGVREKKRKDVELFMDLLQEDLNKKNLPVATIEDAAEYISNLLGVKVR
jgi:hypothetical protein